MTPSFLLFTRLRRFWRPESRPKDITLPSRTPRRLLDAPLTTLWDRASSGRGPSSRRRVESWQEATTFGSAGARTPGGPGKRNGGRNGRGGGERTNRRGTQQSTMADQSPTPGQEGHGEKDGGCDTVDQRPRPTGEKIPSTRGRRLQKESDERSAEGHGSAVLPTTVRADGNRLFPE